MFQIKWTAVREQCSQKKQGSILAKNFVESCATRILEKGRLGLEQLALEIDKVMIFLGLETVKPATQCSAASVWA